MKIKSVICLIVAVVIIILGLLCVGCLKDECAQDDVDTKFMSDYGNLIIGMLNSSIQTEEMVFGVRLFFINAAYLQIKKMQIASPQIPKSEITRAMKGK